MYFFQLILNNEMLMQYINFMRTISLFIYLLTYNSSSLIFNGMKEGRSPSKGLNFSLIDC